MACISDDNEIHYKHDKTKKSILIGLVLAVFGIVLAIISVILIIVLESSLDYDTFNKAFGVLMGLLLASIPIIVIGGIFLCNWSLYCKHCGQIPKQK